jgi:aldose 1-epimerase
MQLSTGRQYRIAHDRQEAMAVELGAGLREYVVGGRHVLDGFAADGKATGSRGLPLLPWPNRIGNGRYRFEGEEHQLPINHVGENAAIHGLTRWIPWPAIKHTASRVVLETTIFPQPGYPFTLRLRVSYELSTEGLAVETTAWNDGGRALPYGAGHHPYLSSSGGLLDRAILAVPATHRLITCRRGLPTGEVATVDGTPYDFRRPRMVGDVQLDTCYLGLIRDGDGRARVRVEDTVLWADEGYGYVMLFTGDTLPDPAERRRSLAVEPMTCPPDAFRTGTGLIVLPPGGTVTTRWGLAKDVNP